MIIKFNDNNDKFNDNKGLLLLEQSLLIPYCIQDNADSSQEDHSPYLF